MLRIVQVYDSRLRAEASSAGQLRLPMMALRMLFSLLWIAAAAILASLLGLDEAARATLVIPAGGLTIMMILHLGYVFTEGFESRSKA